MIPDIPVMTSPSLGSSVAFVAVIGFVAIAITAGVWRGGPAGESDGSNRRWGMQATLCMILWLVIGAVVPISIGITSSPVPFRQYMVEQQVLLNYHFPFSWIVSIAVAGALLGHLVLFRKLLKRADCYIVHTACRILQHNT